MGEASGHLVAPPTERSIESAETVTFSLSQGYFCSSLDKWYMIVKTTDAEQVFAFKAVPRTYNIFFK